MSVADVASLVADVVAGVGVIVVVGQLWLSRRELRADFERTFVDKYDRVIQGVPLSMILGEQLDVESDAAALRAFFDYFELCEEELYYRKAGKVSAETWAEWWEGITLNFRRPAFRQAWAALEGRVQLEEQGAEHMHRSEQFKNLRAAMRSIESGHPHDPAQNK